MYSYSQKKILSLSVKDFIYYSFFQAIVCLLLIFFHVFIMYFYSADYRNKKCKQEFDKIKSLCEEEIKKNTLDALKYDLLPVREKTVSKSNEFFHIESVARLKKNNFQLSHSKIGTIASRVYKYLVQNHYVAGNYCKKFYAESNSFAEELSVKQLPLDQWFLYNATDKKLLFNRDKSAIYSGRIFSEADIVLNYKSDNEERNFKYIYGFQGRDPYTLFINYDESGNWVGTSLTTRGVIDIEIHNDYNNIIFIKEMAEFNKFNNIFNIDPLRMISNVQKRHEVEDFKGLLFINVDDSDINTKYVPVDYINWLKKVKEDIQAGFIDKYNDFNRNNLFSVKVTSEGYDFLFINDMKTLIEEKVSDVNWFNFKNNSLHLDVSAFYIWYKGKVNMNVSVIEESFHKTKALMFFIEVDKNFKKKPISVVIDNGENIPYRTFFHFDSPLYFSSSVNLNENKLSILASDFHLFKESNIEKFIINAVLYKRTNSPQLKDLFTIRNVEESMVLNGSIIFLPPNDSETFVIYESGESNNYLDTKYSWDKNLVDETHWIDFMPSKYYFTSSVPISNE